MCIILGADLLSELTFEVVSRTCHARDGHFRRPMLGSARAEYMLDEDALDEELRSANSLCEQLIAQIAAAEQRAREQESMLDEDALDEELQTANSLCEQLIAQIAAEEERAREQEQEQGMASEMEQRSEQDWDAPLMDDKDANYDRCGTWGCRLPEKHSGLHQTAEPEGRRPRNPVLRYSDLPRTVPQQQNLAARRASVAALHRAEVAAEDEAEGRGDPEIGAARSAVSGRASGSASEASGLQRPRPTFEASSVVLNPTHSRRDRKHTPTYVENPDKRTAQGGHLKVGTRLEDISAFSTHAQWLLHGIPFSDLISQQPPITNHDKIVRILQRNPWCWDFVDAEDDAPGAKPFEDLQPETLTERQSKSLFRLCLGIYSDWENQVNVSKLPMEQQPYEPSIWVCDAAFLWNKSRSICALCNEEMTLGADDSRYPKADPDAVRTPCPNKATLERKWRQVLHVPSNVVACIHHRCQHLTNVARPGVPPTPARLGGPVAYWADAIQTLQAQGHPGAPFEITISTVIRHAKSRLKEEGVAPCPRLPGANGKRAAYPKCLCPWHVRFNALQEVIASEFGKQLKELHRAHTAKYWHNRKRPQTSDSDASEVEEAGDGPRVRPRAAVSLMTEREMDAALEKTLNDLFPDHDDVPFELVYMSLTRMEPRAALAGGKAVEETLIRLEDARRICPYRSYLLRMRARDL